MLTTTIKQPPPATVWLRRNKSLYCLMLPPPQPHHLGPKQAASHPSVRTIPRCHPAIYAVPSVPHLSALSPLYPAVPAVPTPALPPGRRPRCQGPGPSGKRMLPGPQAALETLLFFLGAGAGRTLSHSALAALQTPHLRPLYEGGALPGIHCAPASPAIPAPTGRRGSDPFVSGEIPARAGAVWGWTAACVSIPFCWSPK